MYALATQFHWSHQQTYRAHYASSTFGKRVRKLTKISVNEYVGILFLFIIISYYGEGWQILDTSIQCREIIKFDRGLAMVEAILCFDAWLKKSAQWLLGHDEEAMGAAKASINVLILMSLERLPRNKGVFPNSTS